jgi:transposase
LTDGCGIPLAVTVTGGNRNDVTQLIPPLDAVPPVRGKPGRPRRRPDRVLGDRGYDHDCYRRLVKQRGLWPVFARRGVAHGSGLGKLRWVVERTIAWLHQFRRLAVRWEYRTDIHTGLLKLTCCLISWRYMASSF